jgi:hypothetical protein
MKVGSKRRLRFIMAYTMSRPDQRSVRASWILRRTGEAADTIKPVGLSHDLQENPPSTEEILHNGLQVLMLG